MRDWNEIILNRAVREEFTPPDRFPGLIESARGEYNNAIQGNLNEKGTFEMLYNAAREWCEIILRAEGWRTQASGHHEVVFSAFRHFVGDQVEQLARYFDDMRILRHDLDYDYRPGMIFEHELEDMKKKVKMLEKEVLRWLKKNHPELI